MPLLGNVSLRPNHVAMSAGALMWRVLAVLVIGALLAHWVWVLFAPRSVSVMPAVQPASDSQAGRLFGIAAVTTPAPQVALPNVRLIGVFAGTPGFAVLELNGKQQGLAAGREIVPGATLVEVANDHVVIERGGVRQQIQLERKETTSGGGTAASVQTAVPAPAQVNAAVSTIVK